MASSYTEFGGRGFWARDGTLEAWLVALAQEVDNLAEAPNWLQEAGRHWREQATAGMIGCISAAVLS